MTRNFDWSLSILSSLQIAKLQDDNKALDRLTKSKEAALLEAERTVQVALTKASMVDDLQNKNQELMKQIEICQVSLIKGNIPFQALDLAVFLLLCASGMDFYFYYFCVSGRK